MATTDEQDLDLLRRRLYRPDATDEDRLRFEDLRRRLDARDPVVQPEVAVERRRRVAAPLLIAAAVVVAATAVLATPPAAAPRPAATSAPAAAADPSRPTPVAVSVHGVATTAQWFHGVGPAVVPLVTGSAPPFGGRLVVLLTSAEAAPLGWTAARWGSIGSGPSTSQVIASSPRRVRGALGRPDSADYGGDPPVDIEVSDPGSHAWTLTVAILEPER